MKHNKGFSFVELLVAVAILGIISLPIASSFALAAKTDAKAVHLSAMNDAADDVMLLLEEIETLGGIPADKQSEYSVKFDYYISDVFSSLLSPEKVYQTQLSVDKSGKNIGLVIRYKIQYNGYNAILTISEVAANNCYRIDLEFTHTVAGSPLEVQRKGLLKYA